MEEAFSIKWTEFHKNISQSFNELREEETFFDVTLIAEDEVQIQAHKLVLSAGSDFFKSILLKNSHLHPLIYLSGIASDNLAYVLDYIYNGEVKISKNALYDFIKVAQKLKLQELRVDVDEVKVEDDSIGSGKVDIEDDTTEEKLSDFRKNIIADKANGAEETIYIIDKTTGEKIEPLYFLEENEEISSLVVEELNAEKLDDFGELNPDDSGWDYYEDLSAYEQAPEVRFDFREKVRKTGSKAGALHTTVTLYIGDRVFRKRRSFTTAGLPTFTFSCNGCEAQGKWVYALVKVIDDEYKLKCIPKDETHCCSPKKHCTDIMLARKLIEEKIKQEPARRLPDLYNECLESYCATMDPQAKQSFLEFFPKLDKIKSNLWKLRTEARKENPRFEVPKKGKKPDLQDFICSKDGPLPEHRFHFKETIGRFGSKLGVPSTKVSLYIGNRTYRKRTQLRKSGMIIFTCNGCDNKGKYLAAFAKVIDNEYQLERVPLEKNHVCVPKKHCVDVKEAMKLINEKTMEEPTRSIREIYDEVKKNYIESIDPEMKESFLESIPKYKNVVRSLQKRRKISKGTVKKRTRDPNDYISFDEPLPEHRFHISEMIGTIGSKAGVPSTKVSLYMGSRVYRKRIKNKSGLISFTCNGCDRKGIYLSALVKQVGDEYKLYQVPKDELHVCNPKYLCFEVKMAVKMISERALEEPSRSIAEIYREVKENYAESLEPQDWQLFLDNFPKLKNIESSLYRRRRELRQRAETGLD